MQKNKPQTKKTPLKNIPKMGGDALFAKRGPKHYKKMAKIRWANYRRLHGITK